MQMSVLSSPVSVWRNNHCAASYSMVIIPIGTEGEGIETAIRTRLQSLAADCRLQEDVWGIDELEQQ